MKAWEMFSWVALTVWGDQMKEVELVVRILESTSVTRIASLRPRGGLGFSVSSSLNDRSYGLLGD